VVEHIKDDRLAIANCKKLLKKNGHLIILVPFREISKEQKHSRLPDEALQ
jgi:2-polyprenyl-3-methyl-5-hydroxy-6-metoxy-1,4-benzoquinol methylase